MAELRKIMQENDFNVELYTTQNLGNNPDRTKLDLCLTENGFTLPLPQTATFFVVDSNSRLFSVTRFEPSGRYGYEKLTVV